MSVLWVAAAEAIVESMAEVTDPVAEAKQNGTRQSHQNCFNGTRKDEGDSLPAHNAPWRVKAACCSAGVHPEARQDCYEE